MTSEYVHSLLQRCPLGKWMLVIHGPHILPVSLSARLAVQHISTPAPVLAVAFNHSSSMFAAALDNKSVCLWTVSDTATEPWRRYGSAIPLVKKASAIQFTPSSDAVLVADRFGNIVKLGYDASEEVEQKTSSRKDDNDDGEEEEDSGDDGEEDSRLVLGHFGTVADLQFTSDGKYLISADRDDRIRVSKWPHAYSIESFCLGHKAFVLSARNVGSSPFIVSGSGDGTIRSWNLHSGDEISKYLVETQHSSVDSATGESSNAVVTDLSVHHESGLVFASLDQEGDVLVLRLDKVSGQLRFLQRITVNKQVFAVEIDDKKRLWVMGETPRFQVFSLDDADRVNSSSTIADIEVDSINSYLTDNLEKHIPALYHLFLEPTNLPASKKSKSK